MYYEDAIRRDLGDVCVLVIALTARDSGADAAVMAVTLGD